MIKPGEKILLKPNLLAADPPGFGSPEATARMAGMKAGLGNYLERDIEILGDEWDSFYIPVKSAQKFNITQTVYY